MQFSVISIHDVQDLQRHETWVKKPPSGDNPTILKIITLLSFKYF